MHLKPHPLRKLNPKPFAIALILFFSNFPLVPNAIAVSFDNDPNFNCTDLKVIFARGSGSEIHATNYQYYERAFRDTFSETGLSVSFYELGSNSENGGYGGYSYPSPGIGIYTWARFKTSLGALVSGGEYYSYGDSVEEGSNEAAYFIMHYKNKCPASKIIIGGYSQGANTVSRTLQKINPSWIDYALTFGDPKLYLPEGKPEQFATTTRACREGHSAYSHYRTFVPDCYTYEGILGGYKPYDAGDSAYNGKLKAYCQMHDVICSSYIDIFDLAYGHATYKEQGTYKRAAEDVYNAILGSEDFLHPAQNVAILFDATGSMGPFLAKYQDKAMKVASSYLKKGGKVALYTYNDLATEAVQPTPVELCNFETCTLDNIRELIGGIEVSGGLDNPESLLSASYRMMTALSWTTGANKSVVVLTDDTFHNPDLDGTTLDDVVRLSEEIDPVNFYILTESGIADMYAELVERTRGGVYTSDLPDAIGSIETEINLRTGDYSDTQESLAISSASINNLTYDISGTSVNIEYNTDAALSILTINDEIMGYTELRNFTITDLDLSKENIVCLSPVSTTGLRGERKCVTVQNASAKTSPLNMFIPKAPNTSRPNRG